MTALDAFNNGVTSPAPTPATPPASSPPARSQAEELPELGAGDEEYQDAGVEQPSVDKAEIRSFLASRRFNRKNKPEKPRAVWTLQGVVTSTPGNITTIVAQSKAGKSAVIGAMISAVQCKEGADCLGFISSNPMGHAVVHLDTEQAEHDHWYAGDRACRRAGSNTADHPPWLYSYCVTGETVEKVNTCLIEAIDLAIEERGGLHSIILDGGADLVVDVNDQKECNTFVLYLMRLARKYKCPVVVVLHLNPSGEKSRGHLGSNLERKSESNLRIDKYDDLSVLWSDGRQRHQNIPKDKGSYFLYSKEVGMHVTTDIRLEEKKPRKTTAVPGTQ